MFYRSIFVAVMLLATAVSLYADNDINSKLDELLLSLQSTITVDKGDIKTGLKKLSNGMQFEIFRLKGEIKHPITGEPMGKQRSKIGDAVVVNGKLQFGSSEPLLTGDEIIVKQPFSIETNFTNLDKNQAHEINFEINKNNNVSVSTTSDYKFKCFKDNRTGDINCELAHNETILMQAIFSRKDISIKPLLYLDIANKSDTRFSFNRGIISMAVGYVYGKDRGPYIIASDKSNLYIYKINDNLTISEIEAIDGNFNNIVSVESVDVNGNGIDEIFVSNVKEKNSIASSLIYEFNGKRFDVKSSKLEYLFRSYYSNGKRGLLAQNFLNFEFAGLIGVYGYVDEKYKVVADITGSLGSKVYGSAILSTGDYAYINKAGNFTIRYNDNLIPKSIPTFGDTNKHVYYSREKIVGSRANPAGGEMSITESFTVAHPIYQRIIEVDRNKFFLSENIPAGKSVDDINIFQNANFGVYLISLSNSSELLDVYEYQQPLPATPGIIEADTITYNDKEYILALTNESDSRYDTSSRSFISLFQILR